MKRQLLSYSKTRNRRVGGRTMIRCVFQTSFRHPLLLARLQLLKFGASPTQCHQPGWGYFITQTLSGDLSIKLDCQCDLIPKWVLCKRILQAQLGYPTALDLMTEILYWLGGWSVTHSTRVSATFPFQKESNSLNEHTGCVLWTWNTLFF